jgi:hypothetical protein
MTFFDSRDNEYFGTLLGTVLFSELICIAKMTSKHYEVDTNV